MTNCHVTEAAAARLRELLTWTEIAGEGMGWPAAFAALDAGADPDTHDGKGWTLLLQAIRDGQEDTVDRLLARGADPGRAEGRGRTPLMFAAESGEAGMLASLLAAGAALDVHDHAGVTALVRALQYRRIDIARTLLDHGASPNRPAGLTADQISHTPLMYAMAFGDHDTITRLLERGADPNARDAAGQTVLMRVDSSSPDLIRLLIRHGADPSARDARGHTLPFLFAKAQRADLLETLDDILADPARATARRQVLDPLTPSQRHRWLPRSTAATAAPTLHHRWDRRP